MTADARSNTNDPVRTILVRPACVFGCWRNVLILIYSAAPSVEDLEAREPWLRSMIRRHPDGIAVVTVIEKRANGALPDRHVRAISERQIKAVADDLKCGAVVLEGDGVQFTLLRSLLRGTALITRQRFPYKFFDDVPSASRWVATHLDDSPTALSRAIEELRARNS